ncbi:MAG: hypothetical protein HY928_18530 [Elusimicrobia bacterium]|nr:hypothetical protein [Elusimicrobiota bacterium]
MKKHVKATGFLVASLLVLSFAVYRSGSRTLCEGFLPENDLKIPVGDVSAAGIEPTRFENVLDRIQAVYGPIIAAKGGKLVIKRLWDNPTVNASAQQMWGQWIINMYGGLARHPAITEEGFALVACHEIGHHLGGYPKSSGWATNEGGADYFSTLKCLRLILPSSAPSSTVDPVAESGCAGIYGGGAAANGCRNNALAGQSVAFLFQALRGSQTPPQFGTPDTSVVDSMYNAHPETQCRLDTYFQGALCTASVNQEVDNNDPNVGACTRKGGYQVGLRSRCWYKPPADEPALDKAPAMVSRPELKDTERIGRRLEALRAALSGRGV